MTDKKINKKQPSFEVPKTVTFCKRCVQPNTRPSTTNEYKHTKAQKHAFIVFDENGVCAGCRFCEAKFNGTIDWKKREEELLQLLDKHRSKDGSYDCIVPGSGGKDSVYTSHILKSKYGMHPLTVTWAPHLYTDIGWKNFQNWAHVAGHDNYLFTPNGEVHRRITRNAFLKLLHPFQPFILGQKTFAIKMAARFNIPLVFYGPHSGEEGSNIPLTQNQFVFKDDTLEGKKAGNKGGYQLDFVAPDTKPNEVYLGGASVREYMKEGTSLGDLAPYLPLDSRIIKEKGIKVYFLGYFLNWIPQEAYYYATENSDFETNPSRSEGTYTKYSSLDDKTDGFFYYTTFIKFGYGRATLDASQEIRHGHITRDEGVALVRKFDGEFPQKYFKEFLEYIDVSEDVFWNTINMFRSPELWEKKRGEWELRHRIS